MVSCSHVLSAVTILTQVVALVNDFVRKVVKAGTGARRPVGSFSSSKLYKIDILYNLESSILQIAGFSNGFS